MDIVLFKLALASSLIGTGGYILSLKTKRVTVAKVSMWIMLAVFILLTASFGFRCLTTGRSELISFHGTLTFFAWALAGAYLLLQLRTKTRVVGVIVSPLVSLILIIASAGIGAEVDIPPILRGSLVVIHVMLTLVGEALFVFAAGAGAIYLLQERLIKRKQGGGLSRLLPSLVDLDRINHLCLSVGFPLLTLGVIAGSLWARHVWGSHWQWDPKQVWTLLAWLIYGFLLNQRLAFGWKGRRIALFSLSALILLVLLLLVRLLLPTMHRFV